MDVFLASFLKKSTLFTLINFFCRVLASNICGSAHSALESSILMWQTFPLGNRFQLDNTSSCVAQEAFHFVLWVPGFQNISRFLDRYQPSTSESGFWSVLHKIALTELRRSLQYSKIISNSCEGSRGKVHSFLGVAPLDTTPDHR